MFLLELEYRGVGVNVREGQEALPSIDALRCAAVERGMVCPAWWATEAIRNYGSGYVTALGHIDVKK
jgi:hypothetical protein